MKFATEQEWKDYVKASRRKLWRDIFFIFSGFLGLVIAIYVILGLAVDAVVTRLPEGFEQQLGILYARQFSEEEQSPAEVYLQEVLDTIVEKSSSRITGSYSVHLIPSAQPNAFALPGGHIVVYSALLEELDSENELAFILAHELGHFANRDHLRGLGRRLVMMTMGALLFGVDNRLTEIVMGSLLVVEMKFSRSQETKADLFALDLLNSHYGHIAGATDFFQKTLEDDVQTRLAYYFATHPYPADRVEMLRKQIQEKGYQVRDRQPLDSRIKDLPYDG